MLPGLKAALNYHPLFVHFPIVLWLLALLFELLAVWRGSDDLQRTASRMLYLGTLAAIVTMMTGLAAQKSIPPGDAQRMVGIHEALMLVATSLALRSLHFRMDDAEELHRAVAQGACCSDSSSWRFCSPLGRTAARSWCTATARR